MPFKKAPPLKPVHSVYRSLHTRSTPSWAGDLTHAESLPAARSRALKVGLRERAQIKRFVSSAASIVRVAVCAPTLPCCAGGTGKGNPLPRPNNTKLKNLLSLFFLNPKVGLTK